VVIPVGNKIGNATGVLKKQFLVRIIDKINILNFNQDIFPIGSGRGLMVRIHNLCAASCGFKSQKKSMVVAGRASDLNSLLSPSEVSKLGAISTTLYREYREYK